MVDAFPLQYPKGWKRTDRKEFARFKCTFAKARSLVLNEVRLLGGKNIVISSNIPLKNDGLPYASFKPLDDTAVAVYFYRKGKEVCVPCDKWKKAEDNLYAIGLCISALRGLERWGAKDMVDASFQGFIALPSPSDINKVEYFIDCSNLEMVENRYKVLRKELHPDVGGSDKEFSEMMQQYNKYKLKVNLTCGD